MADRQTRPAINTKVNRNMISGQLQAANVQSPWRAPNFSNVLSGISNLTKQYYDAEKEAAFKRFDLEASRMQMEELESIRVADSNEAVPEIEKAFKSNLNGTFSQDNWGKMWLAERGDLFLRANSNDVLRAGMAKQKELATLQMNKTINTWTNDIATSAPDKAKVLVGDMNRFIDNSDILSPEEKQKTKDNATKLYFQRMASANPQTAINLLKDKEFVKDLNIDAKGEIDSLIKKQFAEIEFQNRVKEFNNERELSEKLDGMPTDEALRFLNENEGNVSRKYFKAREKSLLSSLGITADTQAETAQEILLDISLLPKDAEKVVEYYKGTQNILAKIEENYADGKLSSRDKKSLINQIYKKQGANLAALAEDTSDDAWWRYGDFTYKDANEYIKDNYSGADGNRILLEYFRKVGDEDGFDSKAKKDVLKALISQANDKSLSLPSFMNEEEARKAYEDGKIKKGDKVYINGIRGTI